MTRFYLKDLSEDMKSDFNESESGLEGLTSPSIDMTVDSIMFSGNGYVLRPLSAEPKSYNIPDGATNVTVSKKEDRIEFDFKNKVYRVIMSSR